MASEPGVTGAGLNTELTIRTAGFRRVFAACERRVKRTRRVWPFAERASRRSQSWPWI